MWEGKPAEEKKEVANGESNQKSSEVASDLPKDPLPTVQASDNTKVSENGSVAAAGDAPPQGAKPVVPEKRIVSNGVVANGC